MNIIAQGFERGNIHYFGLIGEFSSASRTYQAIQTDEKSGERLPGAGGG
jgi:hypothetical protein